jgi:hypothetical protein
LITELKASGLHVKEIFADVTGKPFHHDSAEMAITAVPAD